MTEIPNDTYDPCATYLQLREAHTKVLLGESVKRVRFRNGEEERETEFSLANIDALKKAMDQARAECMQKTTGRPTRHAIGIGHMGPVTRVRGIY